MTTNDRAMSPYLSLRQAIRPAIFAHQLLADDSERARKLAAQCTELLVLSRELVKAAGHGQILAADPRPEDPHPEDPRPDVPGEEEDRQAQLLEAYADAAMGWAKVVGSLIALAGTLLDRGDWDDVRRLAGVLHEAGEENAAADLRARLGKCIWDTYQDRFARISSAMSPEEIAESLRVLHAVLLVVPEEFPDRNREVNRLLVPLASAIHHLMRADAPKNIEISYNSRVEHIATGGVARYPDIVKTSLDELSAEFEAIRRPHA